LPKSAAERRVDRSESRGKHVDREIRRWIKATRFTQRRDEGKMVSLKAITAVWAAVCCSLARLHVSGRGELFSMDPQHANVYAPGKRPFHTILGLL
jgi:hypothetical protein